MLFCKNWLAQDHTIEKALNFQDKVLFILFSFDFFKLHDVDTDHQRNYFDQYVYKTIKGWISLGD